jgi:hypothetical protein
MEFKPEEQAEIIIWDWLKTKGDSVIEVYFNRTNKLGWKTFSVKGIQKKPDFIIEIDNGYGREYIAMEIKASENSKIIDYLESYVKRETVYFVNEKEIKIKHFIIGTENSPKGYLFWDETLIDNLAHPENKSKYYVATLGIIPRYEGHRTFEFIRTLWNIYGDIRNNFEEKCGVGVLMADVNDSLKPKIMVTSYNLTKKRWGQRFWKL